MNTTCFYYGHVIYIPTPPHSEEIYLPHNLLYLPLTHSSFYNTM